MDIILRLIDALWFILPAYFANSMPVNVSKIRELKKLGTPVDGGGKLMGRRILGKGKTWRGVYAGIIAGVLIGVLQMIFHVQASSVLGSLVGLPMVTLPLMTLELAFLLSLGALVGDMAASFVKRRSGLKPGDPAPLLDQLDFVFGAFFFSYFLIGIDYDRFFVVLIITPGFHLLGNFIAWAWKLKKKPW